jgi:hypothetical protein
MNAGIEVRNLVDVKGKGAVAIGYLREGAIRVGQQTQPLALDAGPHRILTLAAVVPMHALDGGPDAMGLVFRERPSLTELRLALTAGAFLQLQDTTIPGSDTA